ncbi:hypothetical protein C0J52_27655 [Blattella germanica]|nr:hypothetical protein C0J52_27655 [Blattella germanica]
MTCDSDDGRRGVFIGDLPVLVMEEIFSYLNPKDLAHCAQVCSHWNELAYQPVFWRRIAPIQWAQGIWNYYENFSAHDTKTFSLKKRMHETIHYDSFDWIGHNIINHMYGLGLVKITTDELVEIIDSKFEYHFTRLTTEFRVFLGLILYVLNRVGLGVKVIDLSGSVTLNDHVLNIILTFCPNVEVLNASYTAVGHDAFNDIYKAGSCRKLKTMTLKGCSYLEDWALRSLAKCWKDCSPEVFTPPEKQHTVVNVQYMTEQYFYDLLSEEEELSVMVTKKKTTHLKNFTVQVPVTFLLNKTIHKVDGLKSIDVSGCYRLSDDGLEEMIKMGTALTQLEHIDFSGCSKFTGRALHRFVSCCGSLLPENFFYCDHIIGGPYSNTANGCLNLQCPERACCINME